MARNYEDWISAYLDYTKNTEPPESFRRWVAISTIAAVLQRKCFFSFGAEIVYPNQYIVLVAPAGAARKGTAMRPMRTFLQELGIEMSADATSREALIKALKESSTIDMLENGEQVQHSSLTIFSSELSVFIGFENKSLITTLTQWWDCESPWEYDTIGRGREKVLGPWVNLIGATTPEQVQSTLPRDMVGTGLASRIIFVYEPQIQRPIVLPYYEEDMLQGLLEDLSDMYTLRGQWGFDESFVETYGKWYLDQHANPPQLSADPNFAGYMSRRPVHLWKLCLVICASENKTVVTGQIFDRARRILEEAEVRMPRTFTGLGSAKMSDVTARIMAFVAERGETTDRELLAGFYADLENGHKSLSEILVTMSAMGFIELVRSGRGMHIKYNPSNPLAPMFGRA